MSDRAFIIGCGRIAGGYNYHSRANTLTHALAYQAQRVPIVACQDTDEEAAALLAKHFDVPRHGTHLETLLQECTPTLVSICTPPEARLGILEQVVKIPSVRAIIIEKPLSADYRNALLIDELLRNWGKCAIVNYTRAFQPFYLDLENRIKAGEFGNLSGGTCLYYGAPLTNASHWLERIVAHSGAVENASSLPTGSDQVILHVRTRSASYSILPAPDVEYSPYEMDLFFDTKRIRVVDSEMRVEFFESSKDALFVDYSNLKHVSPPDYIALSHEGILNVVNQALSGNADQSLKRALEVQRILMLSKITT